MKFRIGAGVRVDAGLEVRHKAVATWATSGRYVRPSYIELGGIVLSQSLLPYYPHVQNAD